ncbi:MAG TPA: GDSL-type esterase/lipase family protein [Polyangiaceae bacterium]|nr:GDSL-type esterase/lipase family protein [Polyangiaceae bacterium]
MGSLPEALPPSDPPSAAAPAGVPSGSGAATPLRPIRRGLPELGPFYEQLEALARAERDTPVRVLWLGDSHTAADFMTERVRARLFEVAGAGGPGFVHVGLGAYRHGSVRVETSGRWRHQPILPAQRARVMDGVFGYGGQRTIPTAGATARLELKGGSWPRGQQMRWTIAVRLAPGDKLQIGWADQTRTLGAEPSEKPVEVSFVAPAESPFSVRHLAGSPEVFGVFVERVIPGALLDNVGINGARVATPLAWEPAQYERVLQSHRPDLLVLAYGTNEAFDKTDPARYGEHYRELVGRVRRAAPAVPCWIIGAPDAATSDGRSITRLAPILDVQERVARELGCAFTSAQQAMGGEGSFERWLRASPPLARSDRIHLTVAGYDTLGQRLADALLPAADAGTTLVKRAP